MTCHMEAPNKLHFHLGVKVSATKQIDELKKFVKENPADVHARVGLAKLIGKTQDRSAALAELKKLSAEFSHSPRVHHELEQAGDLPSALVSFQRALDLNTADIIVSQVLRLVS